MRQSNARRSFARFTAILVAIAGLTLAATAVAEVGALEYEDCVRDNDSLPGLCVRQASGLDGAQSIAVSPDGESLYAASFLDEAVVRFDRNPETGELTPAGCISDDDTGSPDCAEHVDGLGGPLGVTMSADGTSLYVAAALDSAVVRFKRDPATGALIPRGCVDDAAAGADACTQSATGLFGASALAASADGKSLYAAAPNDNAIVRFNRDPAGGAITPRGCVEDDEGFVPAVCPAVAPSLDGVSSVAVSADGTSLYAAATDDDAIARFDRSTSTGALTPRGCIDDADSVEECAESVSSFDRPRGVTTSADGRSVYVAIQNDNAIFRFNRTASGALVPNGCVADNDNAAQECIDTTDGLDGAHSVAVSADGKSLYAASQDDDAIVRFNRTATGALTAIGCVDDETGVDACAASAEGLDGASSIVLSADGSSAYSAAFEDDSVASFGRGAGGALTPRGCFDDESGVDACTASADGLGRASGVAVSADGRSVYVSSEDDDAIARFDRDPASGALTPAGCVDDDETGPEPCAQVANGLDGPAALALSPDGGSLYAVAREDNAIVRFKRDPASGALTPAGCVDDNDTGPDTCARETNGLDDPTSVAVSGDGKSVYVTSFGDDAVVRFNRDVTTGSLTAAGCVDDGGADDCAQSADALRDSFSVAVSPDGNSVYVTSFFEDAIARFHRNTTTGALTPAGCIEDNDASFADCAQSADGLDGAGPIALSPTGESLYVAAALEDAITWFNRGAAGALVQKSCVQDNDTGVEACGQATDGLERPLALVVSADGRSVYTATAFDDAIVRFSRANNGQLTPRGCITDPTGGDTCSQIVDDGFRGLTGLALSADDRSLYVSDGGGTVGGKVMRFTRTVP